MTTLDIFVYLLHEQINYSKAVINRRKAARARRLRSEAKRGF